MFAALLVLETVLLAQVEEKAPQERPYWLEFAKQHIAESEVFPTDKPDQAFRALPEPVFHHIQNTRNKAVGSVFLYLEPTGRPAAVCDVFFFPKRQQHQLRNEWHSLASVPITVKWNGGTLMQAPAAGLQWDAVPDVPALPASRPQRQRQLREIARRFTAHLINASNDRYELRLLTTPLYQYHADEMAVQPAGYLSGGLFAVCQENDPEIFLVIEAKTNEDGPRWMYAIAEFSNLNLFVQLDGKDVWSANPPRFDARSPHTAAYPKDVDLAPPPRK